MSEEGKQEKKKYLEKYKENQPNNKLKETKENNKLKSVEADVATNFDKYELKGSSDAEVYTDDDDSEDDRVIGLG